MVHIPKKKRKKRDDRSYQSIYIGYEGTNQYRIYKPHSGQVSVIRDVHFDEIHRYDKKNLKPQKFVNNEWHKEDDELFANPIDLLDASKPIPQLDTIFQKSYETHLYYNELQLSSPLSDISDSVGDKKHYKENDITPEDQLRRETEEWLCLQFNRRDRDLNIQPPDAAPKRSRQDYFGNLILGTGHSTRIKGKMPTLANVIHSVSATPSVPKSHIYMVMVLANLSVRYDDSGPDESLSLRKAIASPYWNDFEKIMHAEFQSFIENNTWEYRNIPSGRAILTSR